MLEAHGVTDKGCIRPTNEDCFIVNEALQLCVVADGVGGHQAGAVAARIAVDVVADFVAETQFSEAPTLVRHPFGVDSSLSEAGNIVRTAIQLAVSGALKSAQLISVHSRFGNIVMRPRQASSAPLFCPAYQEIDFMPIASALALFIAAMSCVLWSGAASAQVLDKVSFGTNWVAEGEHGGFYQALADGTYRKYGLDVTIVPGGPSVNNQLLLPVGKIDFYLSANSLQGFDAVARRTRRCSSPIRTPAWKNSRT